ncbi:hypothetical protein PMI13_02432 [Chryseobacterium populi]|uniref:Uncharacterized protein n=1 Tax=Chryseobacterium populi TaxID=1144316 RepID=J3CH23_9FLAO|nr:hypothetical protein PMI13_02432 [Chryseobacterium populi]
MKKNKEQHKLPLIFKYLEFLPKTAHMSYKDNIIVCGKYQTNFYGKNISVKPLTRML